MNLPNFFILGAPRCGTTALSRYISQHPQVCLSRPKESHYLLSAPEPDLDRAYLSRYVNQFFCHCNGKHKAIGEGSVTYLYSDTVIERILNINPDAKLIVMVRNPIDLLRSYHFRLLYVLQEDRVDFHQAWQLQSRRSRGEAIPPQCRDPRVLQYAEVGKLGTRLERLFDIAGRDRCLTIVFDDFIEDPATFYGKLCHFIDIEPDRRTAFKRRQESRTYRWYWLQRLLFAPPESAIAWATQESHCTLTRQWTRLALLRLHRGLCWANGIPQKPAPLQPQMRRQLQATFSEEVERLSNLLGRDLTHWIAG